MWKNCWPKPTASVCRPVSLCLAAGLFCLGSGLLCQGTGRAAEQPAASADRSPVDLVLATDGQWLVTANQTSNSASLVRVADGQVLHELAVGQRPVAVALHPDGRHVLLTCSYSGELYLLEVTGERLRVEASIPLGYQPHGVAVNAAGTTAYVALTDADQVAVIDLATRLVTSRIDVGRWPRYLAYSDSLQRLAVGTGGDRGVSVVDTRTGQLLFVDQFVGLNIGHLQLSSDGRQVYFPWMVYRRQPITPAFIRLGWVMASRVARLRLDEQSRREAMSLDPPGRAVADPHGLALTSDQRQMVVSAAGTHELLVFQVPGLPLESHGSTDHIDAALLADANRFYRIELGGRPLGLRMAADDRTVFVANYLDNSVQVVDLEQRRLSRTIPLGGSSEPSLARRGEAIFYDARRSLDQWYSCHSCHYEAGSNAVTMDTNNDGSSRTFKTVLPLFGLTSTAPWTWHGWQEDLDDAMHKSLTSTMLGPEPSAEDKAALIAYLGSLQPPPNPRRDASGRLTPAAERGKRVFEGSRAACASCHAGPHFTDGQVHEIGLEGPADRYRGYNTPSLLGVFRKVRLLHDGRCGSLEELLTGPHAPEKVAGSKLDDSELRDLIEYLKSL
ncbi:MAG: c-type cytochrome [Pirellulaceae bacterium]|nr:c-type cytochrome [Pirellulaceae bacterium]